MTPTNVSAASDEQVSSLRKWLTEQPYAMTGPSETRMLIARIDELRAELKQAKEQNDSQAARLENYSDAFDALLEERDDLQRQLDEARAALRVVAKYFEVASRICRECGWDHGEHHNECPVPVVLAALTPPRAGDESGEESRAGAGADDRSAGFRDVALHTAERPSAHQSQASDPRERVTQDDVHDYRCRDAYCMGCVAIDDPSLKPAPQPASVTPTREELFEVLRYTRNELVYAKALLDEEDIHVVHTSGARVAIERATALLARLENGGGEEK